MNEQEPTGKIEQKKLTIEPNQNTLERKGNIFMAEGNGGGGPEHGAPKPPDKRMGKVSKPQGQPTPANASQPEAEPVVSGAPDLRQLIDNPNTPVGVRRAAAEELSEQQGQAEATSVRRRAIQVDDLKDDQLRREAEVLNQLIADRVASVDSLKAAFEKVARMDDLPVDEQNHFLSRLSQIIRDNEPKRRGQDMEQILDNETGQKRYKFSELLLDRSKRDDAFNNLFAGVDSTPHAFFREAFNPLTYGRRYEDFMDFVRNASIGTLDDVVREHLDVELTEQGMMDLREDFDRYQVERRVRETLHDANAIIYLPSVKAEDLYKSMQQFSSELGDVAWRTKGVKQMTDIYEACLRESMMANNGVLRPEAVLGTVTRRSDKDATIIKVERGTTEEEVKRRFKRMMKAGLITMRNEETGQSSLVGEMPDWEIDRIFTISRGMMVESERLLSLAAESELPGGVAAYGSLFLQDILQSYAPFRHLIGKFGLTESGLAAYMSSESMDLDKGKGVIGAIRRWNPHVLKEALDRYEELGPKVALREFEDEMRYVAKLNPNRCGDMFTWISWRAVDEGETDSMTQRFLTFGEARMRRRWQESGHQGNPPEDFTNEYWNWVGTGIRLEKLRGSLEEDRKSRDPQKREKGEASVVKAKGIIEQMVKFQPHRLYLISRGIRERLAGEFGSLSQEQVTEITTNLSLVETAMLRDRETLLNQGVRFDQLDLTDPRFSHYFVDVIQGEGAQGKIGAALRFAKAVKEDFSRSGNAYWDEFIFKREYKHGFVLWSGDAPIDEFDTAALGPSGGFARRARDNESQAKAAGKELKLLDMLSGGAVTPEQVATGLVDIYKTLAIYDPTKAKRIIMEKYIGIGKFFAADSLSIIPGVGDILGMTRQSSFARMMYGNDMPAWQAIELRSGLNILRNRLQLKPDEIKEMEDALFAAKSDVAAEFAVTMAKLMAIALLIYLGTKVLTEKEAKH